MSTVLNRIGSPSSQTQGLIAKLNASSEQTEEKLSIIQEALSHLASKKDPTLEKTLSDKLANQDLLPIAMHLIKHAPNLLSTCCKVASLDVSGILEKSQKEAKYQLPPKAPSSKITSTLPIESGLLNRVGSYVLTLITKTYSIDIKHPPKNRWEAQSQWSFFRDLLEDLQWIKGALLGYFVTIQKTALAGLGVLALFATAKYTYYWYESQKEVQLNPRYFRDLTKEILPDSLERENKMKELLSCICVAPGAESNIAIITGPPGTGKTELVNQLSQKMRKGEIPQLQGKQLIAVNTANLIGFGKWDDEDEQYFSPLDLIFEELKGKEENVILFFDEFHNAANARGAWGAAKGAMLETLKTALLERGILCILATTEDEYEEHISPHKAFIDRTRQIKISSLGSKKTRLILEGKESFIEIDPKALDAIITTAKTHPDFKDRANPRKSLNMHKEAVNHVYSWRSTLLSSKITQLKLTIAKTQSSLRKEYSDEDFKNLEILNEELAELEQQQTEQTKLHNLFTNLKKQQKEHRDSRSILACKLANKEITPQEADIRMLAWTETVVLPAFKTLIADTIQTFKSNYNEDLPEKVTPELIERLFPIPVAG